MAGGGAPFEFGTISTCGAICVGTKHLRYELVIRDVIAASLEIVATEHLFDGLVLLASCDSIIPGQILGAARLGVPAIMITGGPMLPGDYRGKRILQNKFDEAVIGGVVAGTVTPAMVAEMEECVNPTADAWPLMGTANTMQVLAEALGLVLPGTATIPAVYAEKVQVARGSGRRVVELVREGRRIRDFLTPSALCNAAAVDMAIGGSTNAVLHLLALARELDLPLTLEDFDPISRRVPCLCSVVPNGPHDITDFHRAGGVPAVLADITEVLDRGALTVSGKTVGEVAATAGVRDRRVIRSLSHPRECGWRLGRPLGKPLPGRGHLPPFFLQARNAHLLGDGLRFRLGRDGLRCHPTWEGRARLRGGRPLRGPQRSSWDARGHALH